MSGGVGGGRLGRPPIPILRAASSIQALVCEQERLTEGPGCAILGPVRRKPPGTSGGGEGDVIAQDDRQGLGRRGEELAAQQLAAQGYQILAQNWRCGTGELDLVARDGESLVLIEVRTRRGRSMGSPEESITAGQAGTPHRPWRGLCAGEQLAR